MAGSAFPDPHSGIQETLVDAKGDILTSTAADVPARLAVGTNNHILTADSAEATGLKWAAAPVTLTGSETLTNKTLTSPALTTPTISTYTTAGDLVYGTGSGGIARIAGGTSGYLLTSAGATSSPTWAAASSGALALITRQSFATVSTTTTTFDGVFTSTYAQYLIVIENMFGSVGYPTQAYFQWRVGSTTQSSSIYYGAVFGYASGGTPGLTTININGAQGILSLSSSALVSAFTMSLYAAQVGVSGRPQLFGNGFQSENNLQVNTGFFYNSSITTTGFILSASTGTITGTVAVYGLAKT